MEKTHGTVFKRGDALKVVVNDEDVVPGNIQKIRNQLKNERVSTVIILSESEEGNYLAVKCGDKPKRNSSTALIGDTRVYVYCRRYFTIDPASLVRFPNSELRDQEKILDRVEYIHDKEIARRKKRKLERKQQRIDNSTGRKAQEIDAAIRAHTEISKSRQAGQIVTTGANAHGMSIASKGPPKKLKGYDIVLLKNTNQKAIQRRIFLTNYVCSECPICQKNLMNYVSIIPISDTEGIKVPGKYCSKCNAFWEARGATLQNLIPKLNYSSDYEVHSEYLISDYPQKMQFVKTIPSASVVVHLKLKNGDKHKMVVIVSSRSERNPKCDVLHYTEHLSRQLLFAICSGNGQFRVDGIEYDILKYSYLEKKSNGLPYYMNIDKIILRSGGGLYQGISSKGIELVDILLYSPFTKCFEVSHASYDAKDDFYYMDAKIFRKFISEYGNPGIDVMTCRDDLSDFSTLRGESFLHAYGYSVAQNSGLSARDRQSLLGEVLDLGFMTAHAILCLLDLNINMHPGSKYRNARLCWETDKQYVMGYKINPERFVVSTIGLRR